MIGGADGIPMLDLDGMLAELERNLETVLKALEDAKAEMDAVVAAEREACGLAVERAYLACTYPGVLNRHVWAHIVEEAKAAIRARGTEFHCPNGCRLPEGLKWRLGDQCGRCKALLLEPGAAIRGRSESERG